MSRDKPGVWRVTNEGEQPGLDSWGWTAGGEHRKAARRTEVACREPDTRRHAMWGGARARKGAPGRRSELRVRRRASWNQGRMATYRKQGEPPVRSSGSVTSGSRGIACSALPGDHRSSREERPLGSDTPQSGWREDQRDRVESTTGKEGSDGKEGIGTAARRTRAT
jgi:hypothetical protein